MMEFLKGMPLEYKAMVVAALSWLITEILKKWVYPKFWKTDQGKLALKQLPIFVGGALFGMWGNDEHAILVGMGLGAAPRAVVEIAGSRKKKKATAEPA